MKTLSLWMIGAICLIAPASVAYAHSAYDGSWDLLFVTQAGTCDSTRSFTVNVSDRAVTHPTLREIFRNLGSRKVERPR
jgi:hypothetical protein